MLTDLWLSLRGRRVRPGTLPDFEPLMADDIDEVLADDELPSRSDLSSGYACIIDYCNAKRELSRRAISVIRVEGRGKKQCLRAFCHERDHIRSFSVARIREVYDIETGEVLGVAEMLFQMSGSSWGLSPSSKADVIAGLNILVFMGRCDSEWHPLEKVVIEEFVSRFWLRAEIAGDPPIEAIMAHARRLRPDAEAFLGSLIRAIERPILCSIIRSHITAVVEADGRLSDEEFYWGCNVDALIARHARSENGSDI